MMGSQPPPQENLFYAGFSLDSRVRKNHPLRDIARTVDFNFICGEVAEMHGHNGNVPVPPPVILKLMLLLVTYNVRSERELMLTVPERLDWLWFLGYTLDSDIPNHSVLSKARRKWGVEAFKRFFERVVYQCVERGLVDGKKIFVDSSLVQAGASRNSVVDTHSLKRHLNAKYADGHFAYDAQSDTYACPAGKTLRRSGQPMEDNTVKYRASAQECKGCDLRVKCTSGKNGRTVRRHVRQVEAASVERWTVFKPG